MDFLTAYYRQSDATDTAVLLQQYEWRGKQVCFACLCKAREGRAAAYVTERLLYWFRRRSAKMLTNLVNRECGVISLTDEVKGVFGQADEELRQGGLTKEGENVAVAGLLCIGEVFILLRRGALRGYQINTFLGKACLKDFDRGEGVMRENEEHGEWELHAEWGILQWDVGILVATDSFCKVLGEELLREGLRPGSLHETGQIQKHLEELAEEGERRGGAGMAAILVKSCVTKGTPAGRKVKRKKENIAKQLSDRCVNRKEKIEESVKRELHRHGYECRKLLGQGSFAGVYKVKAAETGAVYACKVSAYKELLEEEFQRLKSVSHPLFPQVYDYWEAEEFAVIRMEYIAGEGLDKMLLRRKFFSVSQIVRVGVVLAEGLLCLHESGSTLVFRDVKPENIMVTQNGSVKLLDFGCVCEAGVGQKIRAGSPGFAAPEQMREDGVDVTADVYGLGQTLRAMRKNSLLGKRRRFVMCKRKPRERRLDRNRASRAAERYLNKVIDACIREQVCRRLPDMRSVLQALAPLCEEGGEMKRLRKSDVAKEWAERCYQKNIWESVYKRA